MRMRVKDMLFWSERMDRVVTVEEVNNGVEVQVAVDAKNNIIPYCEKGIEGEYAREKCPCTGEVFETLLDDGGILYHIPKKLLTQVK